MASFNRTQDVESEIEALQDDAGPFKDDGDSLMERGRRTARALKTTVAHGMRIGRDRTQQVVRQRPFTAVAVALGAGLLIGGWWARRR